MDTNSLKKKFRVWYNPYVREFKFEHFSNRKWLKPDPGAALMYRLVNNKDDKETLQNNGVKLLQEIRSSYDKYDDGIDVLFCGTDSDFIDLTAIHKHIQKTSGIGKLSISKDKSIILLPPKEAKKEIEKCYDKIETEFEDYMPGTKNYEEDKTIGDAIRKFKDVSKPEIKVCILGNFSYGKSTFINALIGDEILPAHSNPETALIYRIHESEEFRVNFEYENNHTYILWDGCKLSIANDFTNIELLKRLNRDINLDSIEATTQVIAVNALVKMLNKKTVRQKITNQYIEIFIPFNNDILPDSDFQLVLIDTPGDNNIMDVSHEETLREMLRDQTDTLPILLTLRDYIVSKDNDSIKNVINEYIGKIDLANKLVVINKSDTIGTKTLKEGISNDIREQVNPKKLIYVSSIMALGSRKQDGSAWIDSDAEEFYTDNLNKFQNPGPLSCENCANITTCKRCNDCKKCKKLYMFNELPDYEYVESVNDNKNLAKHDLVFANSGMNSVNLEIQKFADKFALPLKAGWQRRELMTALNAVEKKREEIKKSCEHEKEQYKKERDLESDRLKGEVGNIGLDESLKSRVQNKVIGEYKEILYEFSSTLLEKVTVKWSKLKKKQWFKDHAIAAENCHEEMVKECNVFYGEVSPAIENMIAEELKTEWNNIIKKIREKIENDERVANEAKDELSNINVDPPAYKVDKALFEANKIFSKHFFKHISIKPDRYVNGRNGKPGLKADFEADFYSNLVGKTLTTMITQLNMQVVDKREEYCSHLGERSMIIKEHNEKVNEMVNRICSIDKRLKNLKDTKDFLRSIAEFKETEGNE